MKTSKRKTAKEIKLEQYLRGFYDCLAMFEEAFRKEAWEEDHRRRKLGLSTLASETARAPRVDALWPTVYAAQQKIYPVDNELRELQQKRRASGE